ncbi:uncharacterized protein LOC124352841 [Homalodisca vitripennis]|uniref:uncharacterized protein LOC124352841 n=1 Tax=Homalodisca vitripennis TaxID=197043 RepID=UPI001EEC0226|nr:uncharacterized protein LOC124352841 [Homalodisca vitripennis]
MESSLNITQYLHLQYNNQHQCCYRMESGLPVYIFPVIVHAVMSDWVELPKLSSTKNQDGSGTSAYKMPMVTLSTPVLAVFTDSYDSVASTIPSLNHVGASFSYSEMKNIKTNNSDIISKTLHTSSENFESENIEDINKSTNESEIIEEAFKNAKNDFVIQPTATTAEKLKYLHGLQDKLSFHIRRLSQGVWTDRQARGKKLMGFASMEGALMTIAFLTFAVFLIKIVHQFIRGLQDTDLTMVLTLPTTAAPVRLSRHSRSERQLAAAQLLQYMDQFSIKHRLYCDSP